MIVDLTAVRKGDITKDVPLQEGDEVRILSKFTGNARVDGQVKNPGEKELNGDVYLLDFLNTAAGGFTELADQLRVRVNRGGKELEFDLVAVQRGVRRNDDPELKVLPGDLVFVPKAVASLSGQVKTAGSDKPIGANTNIYDFIMSVGGGFTEEADKARIRVTRGKEDVVVDLTNVANGMVSKNDPKLKLLPGDEIFVPNDDNLRFVIVGGIGKPGRYPVTRNMTLLDAIAAAGNFTERATRKNFVVARAERFNSDGSLKIDPKAAKPKKDEDVAGQGLEVIDYKKLLKGDPAQNVAIHPGDRILIPEEQPQVKGPKPSFFDRLLRLVPIATLFMGGGIGYPGYGGYGF
jgi:polysaccharide export outer membrane protein